MGTEKKANIIIMDFKTKIKKNYQSKSYASKIVFYWQLVETQLCSIGNPRI